MANNKSIVIEDYSEDGFWGKIKKYCKNIGKDSLEQIFRLYYSLESDKCSATHKTIVYGALAYLVSPIDMIPDLTPILGYTDDMGLIASALVAVTACIDDVVKNKAREKVRELFE